MRVARGLGGYRGTSLIRECPPPWDHRLALGIFLLQAPEGARFFMSEVPLHQHSVGTTTCIGRHPPARVGSAPGSGCAPKGTRAAAAPRTPLRLLPESGLQCYYLRICLFINFRKSTPPQNCQLDILISISKEKVNDFVRKLTL